MQSSIRKGSEQAMNNSLHLCNFNYQYQSVMLGLKTLSCLKTVLRQFLRCLGLDLGLASFVLEFTHTATKEGFPKTT